MENLSQDTDNAEPGRKLRTLGIWLGFAALLVAGIPWYLPASTERMFLGLPLWVDFCLTANLVLAIYTYFAIQVLWK